MKKLLVALLILCPAVSFADTHYMPSGCANLQACFSAMSSGDTLEIASGIYTGASNTMIGPTSLPPSGSGSGTGDARFTIVKAASPGGVTIGDGSIDVFSVNGRSYGNGALPTWIKFDGIIFKGNGTGVAINNGQATDFTTGDLASTMNLYWYLKGCGFQDTDGSENGTINLSYCRYVVFEDCFSWGRARYGENAYITDYIVMRRHIDRRDSVQISSSCPTASYMNYASHYMEYQNVIALDVLASLYSGGAGNYGNFYVRNSYNGRTSTNTSYRGSIALNNTVNSGGECFGGQIGGTYIQSDPTTTSYHNTIFWLTGDGIYSTGPSITASHITFGPRSASGGYGNTCTSPVTITNSNCYNNSSGTLASGGSSAYNNDYNCGGSFSGSNITTTNTPYQYIVKPETSHPDGNDGQKKGAKILYKYGVDGTFYGETGYATAQPEVASNKLWPWGRVYTGDNSWEAVIWAKMRANYDPGDETRGFCGSSTSVTRYVTSAANTITPTYALTVSSGGTSVADVDTYIYEDASDTTAPTVTITTSSPQTIATDSLPVIGMAYDAVWGTGSECKYRIGSEPGSSVGTTIAGLTYSGTVNWSVATSGYSVGANTLYVGCGDAAGNWGSSSITVNYNPSAVNALKGGRIGYIAP